MSDQELISRVFEAIRSDPNLMADIEAHVKKRAKWKLVRWWDKMWLPFHTAVGLSIAAGTIKAVFLWTGTR